MLFLYKCCIYAIIQIFTHHTDTKYASLSVSVYALIVAVKGTESHFYNERHISIFLYLWLVWLGVCKTAVYMHPLISNKPQITPHSPLLILSIFFGTEKG